jgi:DHA1 family purine base/nucleoside efflux pump-like MFS transporter
VATIEASVDVGVRPALAVPSDVAIVRAVWPLLVASFVQTLPLTATSLFLPIIATDVGSTVALVGGSRGLGGLAALLVGALAAPLIDRIPRGRLVPAGLAGVAVASLMLGVAAGLPALVASYLLLGAVGALLQPALQAASADRYTGAAAGRAASMLTAVGALAAVLAGPLLVAPAGLWGWRGDLVAVALVCLGLAAIAAFTLSREAPTGVVRLGYFAAFRAVAAAPGALALILGSTARSGLWMAWLAYLAAYLTERLGVSTAVLGWVWAAGGGSFFIANLLGGRLAGRRGTRVSPERLLEGSLLVALLTGPALYAVTSLPLALALVVALCAAQGVALAALVSLLIRRYPEMRGAVMALNAAGFNLGMFAGIGLSGVGLGAAGYGGLAMTLAGLALVSFGTSAWAVRRPAA